MRIFILTTCAVAFAIVLIYISESKYVKSLYKHINFKSTHEDIWKNTIDYKNGTTLRIFSNNVVYTGILERHEEKGHDSWFVLTKYIVEDNGMEFDSTTIPYDSKIAINIKNVDRIELYYTK